MRVLVAWCPDWPVVTVFGAHPGIDTCAVAEAGRVTACSPPARGHGVRRGQRLRDAQRKCPELVVRERDHDAEGRLFETVVAAVGEVIPWVEVIRPGMCATPVRGPARSVRGEHVLRDRIAGAVAGSGFDCGVGIADSLFAAGLAARAAGGGIVVPAGKTREFLAPYPIDVLDRPELTEVLDRLGVRTLGALAALPVGRVAERFAGEGVIAHRLARGLPPRPLAPRRPPADLSVWMEFDPPAEAVERVVFGAKALAERLHADLEGQGLTCARLRVEVCLAGGSTITRLWRHDGVLSALAVAERVRWQLAGADAPAGEVTGLRLAPDQLVACGDQRALWGRAAESERALRAAARLQAMLGHYAVIRPLPAGGRGPGERTRRVPVGDVATPGAADGPWPGQVPAPAPAVVYARPLPVAVTDVAGAALTVSGRGAVSAPPGYLVVEGRHERVRAWTGPWPAVEYWWDRDRARRRARFQLLTEDDRAYLVVCEKGRWYVEAAYE